MSVSHETEKMREYSYIRYFSLANFRERIATENTIKPRLKEFPKSIPIY